MESAFHPPPLPSPERPVPASGAERAEMVDMLRGFALLGILSVNMAFFATPFYFVVTGQQWGDTGIDRVVENVLLFLAQGKFYVIFAFLFGWGLAHQFSRSMARGGGGSGLIVRRLLLLLAIGVFHLLFIWHGDILVIYALLGLLFLPFRNCRGRTLAVWIVVLLTLPLLWNAALIGLIDLGRAFGGEEGIAESFLAAEQDYRAAATRSLEVFATGSFGEIVVQRLREYGFSLMGGFLFGGMALQIMALFLAGLWVGRRRFLQEAGNHLGFFRRVAVIGLVVGVPANAMLLIWQNEWQRIEPTWASLLMLGSILFGGPALGFAYVSGLVLLWQREGWRKRLRAVFAGVGRTALSNYLFQSLAGTLIFYSYGLGFFGRGGYAIGLVLTVLLFSIQVLLTRWWLQRYRFGPAEWLWRSLTYGQKQPLRA